MAVFREGQIENAEHAATEGASARVGGSDDGGGRRYIYRY